MTEGQEDTTKQDKSVMSEITSFLSFSQGTQLTGRHMGLAGGKMVLVGPVMLNRPEVSASSNVRRSKLGGGGGGGA